MIAFVGSLDYFDPNKDYGIVDNITWVELGRHNRLYDSVAQHADMLSCSVGDKLVVAPYNYNRLVKDESFVRDHPMLTKRIVCGETELNESYPDNIAYNVAFIGEYAIHNTNYTDPVLKKLIDAQGYKWIHTKQGYSNCMMLPVASDALITSDVGLAKTLRQNGFEVLIIEQGHIKLPGLSYGFIGGASFTIGNTVYFNGNVDKHPNGQEIKTFISKKALQIVNLSENQLFDFGSVRFLFEEDR